jgi:hypothetical protein
MSIQTITSAKHENWICQIETVNNTKTYLMQHRTYRYMLALMKHNGEWYAELLTRQTIDGRTSWEPAHNNFFKPLEDAKAEVERRGAHHASCNAVQAFNRKAA